MRIPRHTRARWLTAPLAAVTLLVACGGGDGDAPVIERVVEVPAPTQAVVLSGVGAPADTLGQDGQFYLDAQALRLYGPRANGLWPLPPVALGGASGADGKDGQDGQDGADGSSILSGSGAPSVALGSDGDFYIDLVDTRLYGPKAGGAWPMPGLLLMGPVGSTGPDGEDGEDGLPGPQGPQGPVGPAPIHIQWGIASNILFGNGTYHLWPHGPNATARNPVLLPRACTQARLQVATFGTPSVGASYRFTVLHTPGPELSEIATQDTALVCDIDADTRSCDVGASLNLAAGDAIEVRLVGTQAINAMATPGSWAIGFTCQ